VAVTDVNGTSGRHDVAAASQSRLRWWGLLGFQALLPLGLGLGSQSLRCIALLLSVLADHHARLAERPRFRHHVLGIQVSSLSARDEMLTGGMGQVDAAPRAEVAQATEEIGSKLVELERTTALLAHCDWMIPARLKDQGAFSWCEHREAAA